MVWRGPCPQSRKLTSLVVLGFSVFEVLNHLQSDQATFPTVSLSYSHSLPLSSNLVLDLPHNGIRLRFDGADQRLRLIEILDFQKSRAVYKGIELFRSDGRPTFKAIYNKIFGPTYDGEHLSDLGIFVLSYPGVAFNFPLKDWQGDIGTDAFLRSHSNLPAHSLAVFSGDSWSDSRDTIFTNNPPHPRSANVSSGAARLSSANDEIDIVRILENGRFELIRRYNPPYILALHQTTPQDILTELGPPSAIYRKNDHRLSIHRTRSRGGIQADDNGEDFTDDAESDDDSSDGVIGGENMLTNSGYFYNYFHHGFDIFFSTHTSRHPVATKLILHGNVPGSYEFQRYRRARWVVAPLVMHSPSTTQAYPFQLHSEMKFSEIQTRLQETFGKGHKPMLLNRTSNSPSSSCELLGGWEDSDSKPNGNSDGVDEEAFANTELYGYPGFIFEVLRNSAVAALTVF